MAITRNKLTAVSSVVILLIGFVLLSGGAYLLLLGGSPYYVIIGAALTVSAVLYLRGRRLGEHIYVLILAATLIWAVIEAGTDPWALMARTFAPAVLAIWLALPWVRGGLMDVRPGLSRNGPAMAALVLLLVLTASYVHFQYQADAVGAPTGTVFARPRLREPRNTDWSNYGNRLDGQRFARLSQINAGNVDELQVAWIHRRTSIDRESRVYPSTISFPAGRAQTESTPIKVGSTLFTCDAAGNIYAVDAANGHELWRTGSGADISSYRFLMCRGVSFYQKPGASGPCAKRILSANVGGVLLAIDAATGQPCQDFGRNGRVSLFDGLGPLNPAHYKTTSPVTVAGDVLVVGAFVMDSFDTDMPSGVVRAFDATTGVLRWAWDMGAPDRIGAPPPGQTYTRTTPNAWGIFSADVKLGLVYISTGNPSPDFYGVHRRPFDEKYGSSIVALNLSDGRPRWSFQTTHHDLWDYDVSAQPVLIDVPTAQGIVPAVLQPTKRGDIFVLDRRDGHPIVPVRTVKTPGGGLPGERLSATQPISAMSFIPPPLAEHEMWGATPIDQMFCRIAFRQTRNDGIFTPPGVRPIFVYPGQAGGIDWGSVSVDDDRKVVFANPTYFPWVATLIPREKVPDAANAGWPFWPMHHTPYVLENRTFLGPLQIPCKQPPWGALAAVDLRTNRVLWKKSIGTARDSGPFGLPSAIPLLIGTPSLGGSIATRGDLIFMAATMDRYLRAFDARSGKELWKARLPAGGQATPMTYMANGRQYLVIVAGGNAVYGTREGDYMIAYALPDRHG